MMTLGIGFVCRMGGARESVYERTSPYGGGLCVGRGLCVEEGSVCAGVGCLLRRECVQWRFLHAKDSFRFCETVGPCFIELYFEIQMERRSQEEERSRVGESHDVCGPQGDRLD